MKFRRSIILIYLITLWSGTVHSRSHEKIMDGFRSELSRDDLKYKPNVFTESSLKSTNMYEPTLPKFNLDENMNKPIEVQSKSLIVTNRNDNNQIMHLDIPSSKSKYLSSQQENHLLKISSVLDSQHVAIKHKEGGHEISVNPKFNHIIEISPIEELSNNYNKDLENLKYPKENTDNEEETLSQSTKSQLPDSERNSNKLGHKENLESLSGKLTTTQTYPSIEIIKNDGNQVMHPNEPNISKPSVLSMNVDNHVVKVSSALYSKQIDMKHAEGGNQISAHPKYSHVIEILPINELNDSKKDPEHTKFLDENFEIVQEVSTHQLESDFNNSHPEQIGENSSKEPCSGTSCLISTVSEKWNLNELSNKESPELSTKVESSEILEKTDSTILHPGFENISDKTTLSENTGFEFQNVHGQQSAFNNEFEGSGEEFLSKDSETDRNLKSGRLLGFFSQRNNSSVACTTPKGEKGQCRRISQCLLSDALGNFNVFLQHLCLVRGALVGICCPDNPVIEITNPEDNVTESNLEKEELKQPPEGCGLNTKTRIVGGTISVPHEWTWMVALLRRNRFYCGGVIINNWYILTAAHCILGMNVKDLTVRLGEYDFNEHNKHQEDIAVSEIKRHAQFVTLTFQHDIALLKLKRSIRYSKFVGSICLPTQKARDYSDAEGTVVGWGTVSFGGAASPILRQVTIPVWKNEDCGQTYLLENISDAFMCAGSPEKGEDACQGDSGGPLMTLNDKGRWEVIGIVSWGRRCGDPTYPGVYTRVTTYLDWIIQNIN